MANPKHLLMLDAGATAWNRWRREHPRIKPDLTTAALAGRKLDGYDLGRADLSNADLRRASFRRAQLDGAELYNVDGFQACFDGASLREARLTRGLFEEASFRRAALQGARLLQTLLEKADLTRADFEKADLKDADLSDALTAGTNFRQANLDGIGLSGCDLSKCRFEGAFMANARIANACLAGVNLAGRCIAGTTFLQSDLSGADLRGAICEMTEFTRARLQGADLRGAGLRTVEFREADLSGAQLQGADLENASLVGAFVDGAVFDGCRVYGVSAWDLQGAPHSQKNLLLADGDDGEIRVDDLEVAQVLYLIYSNAKIREFINQCSERNVLILGRFTPPERKAVLDGLRTRLRGLGYVPIVFDFDKPKDRDLTETVQTLAGLSKFVIVDLTAPKSTPLEMEATVKQFKIPFVPIIDATVDERPFAMFVDLANSFHWVLKPVQYRGRDELLQHLHRFVIEPAHRKHEELRRIKANAAVTMVSIRDVLAAEGSPAPARPARARRRA